MVDHGCTRLFPIRNLDTLGGTHCNVNHFLQVVLWMLQCLDRLWKIMSVKAGSKSFNTVALPKFSLRTMVRTWTGWTELMVLSSSQFRFFAGIPNQCRTGLNCELQSMTGADNGCIPLFFKSGYCLPLSQFKVKEAWSNLPRRLCQWVRESICFWSKPTTGMVWVRYRYLSRWRWVRWRRGASHWRMVLGARQMARWFGLWVIACQYWGFVTRTVDADTNRFVCFSFGLWGQTARWTAGWFGLWVIACVKID